MTEKPDEQQKSDQDFKVRYSEKFLREKRKQDKRNSLFGAALFLIAAIGILYETLQAYRTHTWVDLGSRINTPQLFPPIFGVALGVLALSISVYLLWNYFQSK